MDHVTPFDQDDMAAEAYADHQRICGQTHRPRDYRCDLVSPFTVRSFTNQLDDTDRAVLAKMERDAVRQMHASRTNR